MVMRKGNYAVSNAVFKKLKRNPGDRKIKSLIFFAYSPLLSMALFKCKKAYPNIDSDDMKSEINLAALIAMKSYKIKDTYSFPNFLKKIIWTRLRDYCRSNSTQISYPRRWKKEKKFEEISNDCRRRQTC